MENENRQRFLKRKGLIVLIATMNMVVPLSLDMYLPAVPHMTEHFTTSESMVNLTLVGFFFFLAIGILLFGPLSDKYGRKPLLLIGVSIYLVFSAACAIAISIELLIIFRVFQALGAGCMVAVSTALIKDSFSGKTRNTVLAVVQAMAVIAPMVAPLLGAFILTFASWRATFGVLTIIAALCLFFTFFLQETISLEDRYTGTILGSLGRLIAVGRNKAFTSFLILVSALSAPYMAYIAVCSYIYIDYFQLSETMYSYYFAINSAAAILGPILYLRVNGKISSKTILAICLAVAVVSGVLMLTAGWIAPVMFLLAFLPFTIIESAIRPFSTGILLDQQEHDTGSASSLINFVHTVIGSLGMLLGALPWISYISGLGYILLGFVLISLVCWLYIAKSGVKIRGLNS